MNRTNSTYANQGLSVHVFLSSAFITSTLFIHTIIKSSVIIQTFFFSKANYPIGDVNLFARGVPIHQTHILLKLVLI